MIGKTKVHSDAKNVMEYNEKEGKGYMFHQSIVATGLPGESTEDRIEAMRDVFAMRKSVKSQRILHIVLSADPKDQLRDIDWTVITDKYLEYMKFDKKDGGNLAFFAYRHQDTDNDHIHIVLNRICLDGDVIQDKYSRLKTMRVLREIEKELGLTPLVQGKLKAKNAGKRNQNKLQLEKRIQSGLEDRAGKSKEYIEKLQKSYLVNMDVNRYRDYQTQIGKTVESVFKKENKDFILFLRQLADENIYLQLNYGSRKKGDKKSFKGASFNWGDINAKGSDIGFAGKNLAENFHSFFRELDEEKVNFVNEKRFAKQEMASEELQATREELKKSVSPVDLEKVDTGSEITAKIKNIGAMLRSSSLDDRKLIYEYIGQVLGRPTPDIKKAVYEELDNFINRQIVRGQPKDTAVFFEFLEQPWASEIQTIQGMKTLSLYDAKLPTLPESIGKLKNLQALDLNGNLLEKLPDSIGELKNLKSLWAAGNNLAEIPDFVCGLEKLEELNFSFNFLEEIPKNIGNLGRLKELHCPYNQLASLPESIVELENLATDGLKLEENPIESVSEEMKPFLGKLNYGGNPKLETLCGQKTKIKKQDRGPSL